MEKNYRINLKTKKVPKFNYLFNLSICNIYSRVFLILISFILFIIYKQTIILILNKRNHSLLDFNEDIKNFKLYLMTYIF